MRQFAVLFTVACLVLGFGGATVPSAAGEDSVLFPADAQRTAVAARSVAHYILGVSYDLQGMTPEAVGEYEQSLVFDEAPFAPHLRLGADYARLGEYPRAVEELRRASEIDPQDLQSHYLLALVYSSQRDLGAATKEYEIILQDFSKREPQNSEPFLYLGQLYYAQGKIDKAMEQFKKAILVDPKNADAIYLVGSFELEKGQRDSAVDLFKKCLAVDPQHDGCLNSLGYLYVEEGKNLDEAMVFIKRAIEVDPKNGAYLDSLGWAYYQKGMYIEALKELNKAAGLLEDPVIYDHLADTYLKLGQPDTARKNWRKSLELDPKEIKVKAKLEDLEKDQVLNQKKSP